jgi:signal transduction histidine kinase
VKKIVEGEKGTIIVESQEGRGTTIRFTWTASELVASSAVTEGVGECNQ